MSLPGKPRQIFNNACVQGSADQKTRGRMKAPAGYCQRLSPKNIKDTGTRYHVSILFLTARSLESGGGKPHLFYKRIQLKTLLWSRITTILKGTEYVAMLGERLPPEELFTLDISRIPPAYFAKSIQALGFITWEVSCCVVFIFEKDFLSAPFTRS